MLELTGVQADAGEEDQLELARAVGDDDLEAIVAPLFLTLGLWYRWSGASPIRLTISTIASTVT